MTFDKRYGNRPNGFTVYDAIKIKRSLNSYLDKKFSCYLYLFGILISLIVVLLILFGTH
jgi:hypothetical protein